VLTHGHTPALAPPTPTSTGSREAADFSWQQGGGGSSTTAEDRLVREMGPFENYILGMLANFGALPLERLHNMLRVFVVGEPKYEGRSQEQLGAFLALLGAQGKLEAANGLYSKRRAATEAPGAGGGG
jgi:anaphase-promoting complex subunit 2